jgi:hypothetical protein
MLKFACTAAIALLGLVSRVDAHGYVQEITLGSTKYTGYLPYTDPCVLAPNYFHYFYPTEFITLGLRYYNPPPERIVRKIPGNGPVEDLTLIE